METPDLIATALKEVTSDPARYGLNWQMRLGTIVGLGQVTLDGDDNPVSVSYLISAGTPIGTRVFVICVPGGINYLIGQVDPQTISRVALITQSNAIGPFAIQTSVIIDSSVELTAGTYSFVIEKLEWSVATNLDTVARFILYVNGTVTTFTRRLAYLNENDPMFGSWAFTVATGGTFTVAVDMERAAGTGTINVAATERHIVINRIG